MLERLGLKTDYISYSCIVCLYSAWALKGEMRLLGEDTKFDQLMLTHSAVKAALKSKKNSSKPVAQHVTELVSFLFLFSLSLS